MALFKRDDKREFDEVLGILGGEKKGELIDALFHPMFGYMVLAVQHAGDYAAEFNHVRRWRNQLMGAGWAFSRIHTSATSAVLRELYRRETTVMAEQALEVATIMAHLTESRRLGSRVADVSLTEPQQIFRDRVPPDLVERQQIFGGESEATYTLRCEGTLAFVQYWERSRGLLVDIYDPQEVALQCFETGRSAVGARVLFH